MIDVQFQRGLFLPEADLWLDPQDAKPAAFVSHAHGDHVARHDSILCSSVTAAFLRDRYNIAAHHIEVLAFHVPIVRNGFRLRLLPAGHIPGSAMLHATRIADNSSLLYTGDFKTRRSRTTESVNFLAADTLILETTFGLPRYEFPSQLEVEAEVLRFVHDAIADGETPVLLAYALGKAQEALAILEANGLPALLYPNVAAMTRSCRAAGVPGLPEPVEFDGHAPAGHVVIAPPAALHSRLMKGLPAKRSAMLSGWALQPGAKYRYRVDTMIPFSDHADHPGLLECVQRVRPRRILTVHGFTKEFAAELRARGMDAWCATGGDQLELPIQRPPTRRLAPRGPWHQRPGCPLADFTDLCRRLAETGSRVAQARHLATYFAALSREDRPHAACWLTGESIGAGRGRLNTATLRHALTAIPGARDARVREILLAERNLARTARLVLQEMPLRPEPLDLAQTAAILEAFRASPPGFSRIRELAARFATLHPAESETLVKLLTGNLQLGLESLELTEMVMRLNAATT